MAAATSDERTSFWQTIFTVLGPFDIYGVGSGDPLQRSRRDLVVQIFRLIDYPDNLEVSVAALHAIADMADSPVFSPSSPYAPHKLYSILEASGELPSVMESYVRRLEREETEQVSLISSEAITSQDETFIVNFGLANLVRLQILEFLTKNFPKPGYNLAHFLLGFPPEVSSTPASKLIHHTEEGTQFTCFHLILELLAYGLGHPSSPIVALDHPSLGHKCYELLCIMLANSKTCRATINYLREHEDFYRKQLVFFARDPVDPSDVGYTIFEMLQKSALLRGALLDIHLAFADGAWTYARKLSNVLIRGSLEPKSDNKSDGIEGGQSLLSLIMGSVEVILNTDYLNALPAPIADQIVSAAASLVNSCSRVAQLILSALDRIPYDQQMVKSLLAQLVSSVVPVLSRLQTNQCTSESILESCTSLGVSIVSGFLRKSLSLEGSQLAGDEISVLASSSVGSILRPDSTLVTRGYAYSIICDCFQVSCLNEPMHAVVKSCVVSELDRLLDMASLDSQIPSVEADGWKTIACTFICCLMDFAPKGLIIEQLLKSGFVKNFVSTLRSHDSHLLPLLEQSCRSLNSLFLWKSRFTLIQKFCLAESGSQNLIAAGFFDSISNLRILDWHPVDMGDCSGQSTIINRWESLLLPIFRVLSLFLDPNFGTASNLVLGFVTSKITLIQSMLEGPNTLQVGREHADLSIACLQLLVRLPISKITLRLLKNSLSKALQNLGDPTNEQDNLQIVALSSQALAAAAAEMKISLVAEAIAERVDRSKAEPKIVRMAIDALDKACAALSKAVNEPLLVILEASLSIVSIAWEELGKSKNEFAEAEKRQISSCITPITGNLRGLLKVSGDPEATRSVECLLRDLVLALNRFTNSRDPNKDVFQ